MITQSTVRFRERVTAVCLLIDRKILLYINENTLYRLEARRAVVNYRYWVDLQGEAELTEMRPGGPSRNPGGVEIS